MPAAEPRPKPLLRASLEGLAEMSVHDATPPVWDEKRLRLASDAAGVALWSWNVDTDRISLDARARSLWDVAGDEVTFEDLSAKIHPEDLDRVRAAFAATREEFGPYEIDFRILRHGEVAWVSARGRGDDQGIVGRIMFGVFLDVTERKLAEEAREMLANEMSHRVKNLFAIAAALTVIASRAAETPKEMARDLTARLVALGRAHDLVRPVLGEQKRAAPLDGLLAVLLAAYDDKGKIGSRIRTTVPDILVGESAITAMALVIHELATNSVKYGALSGEAGTLDVTCSVEDAEIVLVWTERGGPPVTDLRGQAGFGSVLVNDTITRNLGGTIAFDWPPEGVVVTLRMNRSRLGT
jgi:PAS domain S-box-containing protein